MLRQTEERETWMDQHTAPRVPSTLAATGISIDQILSGYGGAFSSYHLQSAKTSYVQRKQGEEIYFAHWARVFTNYRCGLVII